MRKNRWNNALERFKAEERPEAVLLVAGQPELARIAVTWTQIPTQQKAKCTKLLTKEEHEVWAWLWENTHFDKARLLSIPNASSRTEKNVAALIAGRILYPDGTLNSFVERYLRELVVRLFTPSQRMRQRAAPEAVGASRK